VLYEPTFIEQLDQFSQGSLSQALDAITLNASAWVDD
jgi:hypothetical protein